MLKWRNTRIIHNIGTVSGERSAYRPTTQCISGWMGPRSGLLDVSEKTETIPYAGNRTVPLVFNFVA
jgi:hypothetical protein